MTIDDFTKNEQELASEMAVAVNGGTWKHDYTVSHKIGWCLKVQWAQKKFGDTE